MTKRTILFYAVIIANCFILNVFAQDYVTVRKDGLGDYEKIQEALDDPMRSFDSGVITRLPEQEEYIIGETVQLQARPSENYIFEKWSGDVTSEKLYVSPAAVD